jgi:hypothetical protein
MDAEEFLDLLNRIAVNIAEGPDLPDDVRMGSPPTVLGIGSLPARAATIRSIARRSPELVRWLASGKVLKEGSARWNQLTQGLTAAQKRMVAASPQSFRNFFRRVRMPNEAVRVGQGSGPGTAVVVRQSMPVGGPTGTAVATRAQAPVTLLGGPSTSGAASGAATSSSGKNLLPFLLAGGGAAAGLALDKIFGGARTPDIENLESLIGDTRGRSRRERGTIRDPRSGLSVFQSNMAADLLQRMEEDSQSMRDEEAAIRASAPRPPLPASDEPASDEPESSSVEDVASVLEAMVQDIRGRDVSVRPLPASGFRYTMIGGDRDQFLDALPPEARQTAQGLYDLSNRARAASRLADAGGGAALPRAVMRDMIKPRRRLQPTSPGTFGELLDESITDFQGAPMMSEREILRMLRGE